MTAAEAVSMIKNGDTVCFGGFVGNMHAEEISAALERSFLERRSPGNLTLLYAAGQGDGKDRGLNHLAHEGLVSRVIGGHWALAPKLGKLAVENKIQAYNFPQGVISHLFRDIATGKPGTLTHVGLHTFVDPRLEGGKVNPVTTEDLVRLMVIDGKEYLFYRALPVHVAVVRATYADPSGMPLWKRNAIPRVLTPCAGGKKLRRHRNPAGEGLARAGTLDARRVRIPGIYVDAIVVANPEKPYADLRGSYNPSYCGKSRPRGHAEAHGAGRRAKSLPQERPGTDARFGDHLGIGIPEGFPWWRPRKGSAGRLTLTVEAGPVGGIPVGGSSFGASINPDCILDQPYQLIFTTAAVWTQHFWGWPRPMRREMSMSAGSAPESPAAAGLSISLRMPGR